MDDEQLLDYEEEQEETVDQNKNEPAANGDAKKIKVSREFDVGEGNRASLPKRMQNNILLSYSVRKKKTLEVCRK